MAVTVHCDDVTRYVVLTLLPVWNNDVHVQCMCGNDRDIVSIQNTILVRDSIREVVRNIIIIYIYIATTQIYG